MTTFTSPATSTAPATPTSTAADAVKVYDVDLNRQSSFPVENPGKMAFDAEGMLWVVQDSARVVRFAPENGERMEQAVTPPEDVIPMDVTVGGSRSSIRDSDGTPEGARFGPHQN